MTYDLYPAVDETYNFPSEVREALSKSIELRNTAIPMTNVQRNNLLGAELWDGRLIINTTTGRINRYDFAKGQWFTVTEQNEAVVAMTEATRDSLPIDLLWNGRVIFNTTIGELNQYDAPNAQWLPLDVANGTRTTILTYSGNTITAVTEKNDGVTVKTTTLGYVGGVLTTVNEVSGGATIVTTLTYDGNGVLTGTSKVVS